MRWEGGVVGSSVANITSFAHTHTQVSALLGRIPSAVGYQPTLATDMGTMQERITTTKKGSITSVQVCVGMGRRCICVPLGCDAFLVNMSFDLL